MTRRFEGAAPAMTCWWQEHLKSRPIVKIECGQCRCLIGEVKRDGDQVMTLRRMVYPEPTTPRPQIGAPHVGELDQQAAERARHVLKRFDDASAGSMEVMRQRRDLADAVAPLGTFSTYVCPQHGEITVDAQHLARFVSESNDTRTRTYPIPYTSMT